MSDVLELLDVRQAEKSDEQYANEIGLRGSTLWRYKNGKSDINTAARKKMIEYFAQKGDAEMVGALLAYKTGQRFNRPGLTELGSCYLSLSKNLALIPAA